MKLLNVLILSSGAWFEMTAQAEELSHPEKGKRVEKPVVNKDRMSPDAANDSKPDEGEQKSPFAPSTLMRIRAQKPVEDAPSATVVALPAVTRIRPVLEG